jgi:outer membrane protein OmpA-like peptidoglycan-associated protein
MARDYDPELWELEEELGELESGLWAEDEAVYEALMKGPFPPPRSPVLSGRAPVPRRSLLRPVLNCPTPTRETVSGFSRYSNSAASLPPDAQTRVKNVANLILRSFRPGCQPIVAVRLVGHADYDPFRERREPGFMIRISRARALAVKQALERLINNRAISSRIAWDVRGVGASQLAVRNPTTEAGRRRNRRVEVWLRGKKASLMRSGKMHPDPRYLRRWHLPAVRQHRAVAVEVVRTSSILFRVAPTCYRVICPTWN